MLFVSAIYCSEPPVNPTSDLLTQVYIESRCPPTPTASCAHLPRDLGTRYLPHLTMPSYKTFLIASTWAALFFGTNASCVAANAELMPTSILPISSLTSVSEVQPTPIPSPPSLKICNDALGEYSPDPDFSYYTFQIDPVVRQAAADGGYIYVGVRQHCESPDGSNRYDQNFGSDTENWTLVPLDKFAPEVYDSVVVKRCKKDFSRYAQMYKIHLCTTLNHEDDCHSFCGSDRDMCKTERAIKAIKVIDPDPWVCEIPT